MRGGLVATVLALMTWAAVGGEPEARIAGRLTVEAGAKPADYQLAVLPAPAAELKQGLPVADNGRFAWHGLAGSYYVCPYLDGRLVAGAMRRVSLVPGQNWTDCTLAVPAPRAKVAVTLRSADGRPLKGTVLAHLFGVGGDYSRSTCGVAGGPAGAFDLGRLSPGGYRLFVEAGEGRPGAILPDLAVTSGDAVQSFALQLPPAGGLRGQLLLPGAAPAAGYTVAVRSGTLPDALGDCAAADYALGAGDCYQAAAVAADGTFILPGLVPGPHGFDVRRLGEIAAWDSLEPVEVKAGEITDLGVVTVARQGWQRIFDGQSLAGWKVTNFGGEGAVSVENGELHLATGDDLTGLTWDEARTDLALPRTDYELSLEAMRVDGRDFFCGLTFPVGDSYCSLICGGWGGMVTGISSIDGFDASENELTQSRVYETGRWYWIRVRVTPTKIQAWVDEERIIDFALEDHRLSTRMEVDDSQPLGVCSWRTAAAIRDWRLRRL